jgi:hypothetical protein
MEDVTQTQNGNAAECRFYAGRSCSFGAAHRFA